MTIMTTVIVIVIMTLSISASLMVMIIMTMVVTILRVTRVIMVLCGSLAGRDEKAIIRAIRAGIGSILAAMRACRCRADTHILSNI